MSYAQFARTTFINMLGTLDRLLVLSKEAGMTDEVLQSKLAEDMFPLELQFRVAINQVLLALQQVGNSQVALDTETYRSLDEIRERVAAASALVADVNSASWSQAEAPVDLTLPNGVRFVMTSEEDIRDWLLPNFYFHVTMVYALLRHNGLQIGKMDFLPHMTRHRVAAG